jgi:hypothetical protein
MIEAAVMRTAMTRGFLTQAQVREALLVREELRRTGQGGTILQIVGARYLNTAQRQSMTEVYLEVQRAAEISPPPPSALSAPPTLPTMPAIQQESMPMESMESSDELGIPEFLLSRSSAKLNQPPEDDSDMVKEFLALSADELSQPNFDEDDPIVRDLDEDPDEEESASGIWRWMTTRLRGKKE